MSWMIRIIPVTDLLLSLVGKHIVFNFFAGGPCMTGHWCLSQPYLANVCNLLSFFL